MTKIYCKIKHCRYPHTHTTEGHRCGVKGCKNHFGHGQVEHYNEQLKENLKKFFNETLLENERCTVFGCKYPWSHTKESHMCIKCERRGSHCSKDCIIQSLDDACNKWGLNKQKIQDFLMLKNNIYFEVYVGMGCSVFISHKDNVTNTIFMHSDSWGQYGPETDDSPLLNKFIYGLESSTGNWFNFTNPDNNQIKCPICRVINKKEDIKFIKGLEARCVVCMDNNIEVYFSKCEHSVVCKLCLDKL